MATKEKAKSPSAKRETIRKQHSKVIKAVGKQLDRGEVTRSGVNRLINRLEKVATSRMKATSRKKK